MLWQRRFCLPGSVLTFKQASAGAIPTAHISATTIENLQAIAGRDARHAPGLAH
jgi:hypothetical protein